MTAGDMVGEVAASRARFLEAMLHPDRREILTILLERGAGVKEIAAETGLSAGAVGHQLRRLRRDGLVRLEETRARRGVAEHYYRAVPDPVIRDEEFATFSPAERRRLSAYLIKNVYRDLRQAIGSGTFDSREQSCGCHMRVEVDERGWHELAEIHREAAEKVAALRCRLEARIDDTNAAVIPAASAIFFFELPSLAVQSGDDTD